jgi:hypothetical protein
MERIVIEINFDEDTDPLTVEHLKLQAQDICHHIDASYLPRGARATARYEKT